MRKKIIFLVGPTAVGKTEISVLLANKINAEIISCDSMQVYKGMDIGTQKPSPELRAKVRHHMIDILTPNKEFSAADFRKRSLRVIKALHGRNKIPLFVGGTGLYVKALLDGLFPSPPKNEALRKRLYAKKNLFGMLKKIDPEAAKVIHPNDKKKIVRALEIYYTTYKTKTALKAATRPLSDKFDVMVFGLTMPREELYGKINERVDRMFEEGFLDEARDMRRKKLSITSAQAIGYREAFDYLKGSIGKDDMVELIKANTRRYAKRQLTWFGADKRIIWMDLEEKKGASRAASALARRIKNDH